MEYYIKKNGTDFLRAKKGNNVVYAKIEGLRTPFIKQEGYIVERVDRTVTGLIKRSFIHKRNFEKEYMSFNPTLYNPAHVLATIDSFIEEVRPTLSATGKDIVINDITSEGYIKNFRITHQSTQVGTPTPTTPIPILSSGDEGACNVWVHGKNLWNYDALQFPINNVSNGWGLKLSNKYFTIGQKYTISTNEPMWIKISIHPSGVDYYQNSNITKLTFTYTSALDGLFLMVNRIDFSPITDIEELKQLNVQLEEGTIATPYEPYNGSITSIDYPDGYVGGSLPNGVADTDTEMKIGKVVLNGGLSFTDLQTYTNVYKMQVNGWGLNKNMYYVSTDRIVGIAKGVDGDYIITHNSSLDQRQVSVYQNNYLYVNVEKTKIDAMEGATTSDKFKTYLNQYPITIYYQLATPVDITLTKPQIPLPEGSVTITTTNAVKADLTVEYRK